MLNKDKIYIRGSKIYHKIVIKKLESLGAENVENLNGTDPKCLYFINHHSEIQGVPENSELAQILKENYKEFLLTEQTSLWKEGDILYNPTDNCFVIFSMFGDYYRVFYAKYKFDEINGIYAYTGGEFYCDPFSYRLATDSEKEKFNQLLHKFSRNWNAEKQALELWHWTPKISERYFYVSLKSLSVKSAIFNKSKQDLKYAKSGNCFQDIKSANKMLKDFKTLLDRKASLLPYED